MDQVNRAVDWAAGQLAPYDRWTLVPALLVALYLLGALLLRRVVPVLLAQVLTPLAVLAVGVVGIGALALEFLSVQPFRLVRRPPPRLLYSFGDLTVAGQTALQRWLRGLGRGAGRIAFLRGWALLVIVAAALLWWSQGWCDRHGGVADCAAPVAAWQANVAGWWHDLTR